VTTVLFVSLVIFSITMSITPGPNNIMIASTGVAFGFRRSVPLLLGIQMGMVLLLAVCAAGVGALVQSAPMVQLTLKMAGAVYLVYLAYKLWNAGAVSGNNTATPLRFWHGMAFQFLNPKAWMMALSMVSVYVLPANEIAWQLLIVALVFFTCALPSTAVWAVGGAVIRSWANDQRKTRLFNRVMAGLTALSAVLVLT